MSRDKRNLRPLAVVVYAAFIGLLLASYLSPVQQIVGGRSQAADLERQIRETRIENEAMLRKSQELQTNEGIGRAARSRYGMVGPGEEVFVVPGRMRPDRDGDR